MTTNAMDRPASFTTLPRAFYLDDAALFEAEMRRIWYDRWLYLAHGSELPEPGSYVIRELAGESVLVVRTQSDEIVALLNVCRHRGARMIDSPCGRLKRIVCPYHQWTYGLDGRLAGAPSMPENDDVDYASLGLYRLPVETWHGFIFGCLGETPPAPIGPEIAARAPRLHEYVPERLRTVATRRYDCDANWKVMLENYLECYHCSASHPEFCKTADLRERADDDYFAQSYDDPPYWGTDVALRPGAYTGSLTGAAVCAMPLGGGEFVAGRSRAFGDWAAAATLYFYADYAMVHQINPVAPGHTHFELTWFVNADASDEQVALDELMHVWDMTTRQDVALIERAQAGLASRRYSPGPLSTRHEPYIRSSLACYAEAMAGEPAYEVVRRAG